jgi:pyrroline-5-carboxylate reductase
MPKPIRKAAKLESNAPRLHKGALRRKKTIRRFERRKTKQEKRQLRAKALTTSLVQPISASIRVLPELMLEVLRNLPKKLSSSQLLISAAAKRALYRTRRRKLGQSTDKF